MNCPSCGADGAYVGAAVVECRDALCRHFSTRAACDWLIAEIARLSTIPPDACFHSWVQQPTLDDSIVHKCSKCPATRRRTMVDIINEKMAAHSATNGWKKPIFIDFIDDADDDLFIVGGPTR